MNCLHNTIHYLNIVETKLKLQSNLFFQIIKYIYMINV